MPPEEMLYGFREGLSLARPPKRSVAERGHHHPAEGTEACSLVLALHTALEQCRVKKYMRASQKTT